MGQWKEHLAWTQDIGSAVLVFLQLTLWDVEQARASRCPSIFVCKMELDLQSFPNLKPYMFIFTGDYIQPNTTHLQVIYRNQHYVVFLFL